MKQLNIYIFIVLIVQCGCINNKFENHTERIEMSHTPTLIRLNDSFQIINIKKAKNIDTDKFLSMIKTINYMQLDSKEYIGEITKMEVTNKHIVIMDSFVAEKLFVFDRKGKLLFLISGKGKGPEEYLSLWDFYIDTFKNEIVVNDALARVRMYYSMHDGSFIKREKSVANCYMTRIDNHYVNLLTHQQDFNVEDDFSILITEKDSVLYKGFALAPIQRNNYIVNSFMSDYDGEILYTPLNSDTTYRLNSDFTYSPKYVINQKKSIWNKRNNDLSESEISNLIKENHYTRYSGDFRSTENTAIFNIQHPFKQFIISSAHIWDKRNHAVYKWNITQPSVMKDVVVAPAATFENIYFGHFPAFGNDFLQSHESTLNPQLREILKAADKNSNPIVVMYELF